MSFLNSVLSSIGGTGAPSATPPTLTKRLSNTDTEPIAKPVLAHPLIPPDDAVKSKKRKAEADLSGPSKIMKNNIERNRPATVAPFIDHPSAKTASSTKLASPFHHNAAVPYRGTSKLNPASNPGIGPTPSPSAQSGESAKTLKKGSYAEIMARAKVTQSKPPAVGVISHKPKDQMAISHKKEMKLKKKAIKDKKLVVKNGSRPGSSGSLSSNSPAPIPSNRKKPPQPAYKGTAKPKPQPSYKGTMKPDSVAGPKATSRGRDGHASRNRYDDNAATDEDDVGDAEEDVYKSDESDDMEAGFSDVEQEESAAARTARKEDEEEAKLEAKLKSEKEERKKRLEAMAKKAKPQRY